MVIKFQVPYNKGNTGIAEQLSGHYENICTTQLFIKRKHQYLEKWFATPVEQVLLLTSENTNNLTPDTGCPVLLYLASDTTQLTVLEMLCAARSLRSFK